MSWKNKRVLISGGTGFIGRNLSLRLQREKAVPIPFGSGDCDLTDAGQVQRFFEKLDNIDYIFHLATFQRTGSIQYKIQADQFRVNTAIHMNMLDGWREHLPAAKFVAVGCSCSYPEKDTPLSEDDYWSGKLHDSVEFYGFAKKLLQVGLKAHTKQLGLKSVYLILSTVYGPGDNFDDGRSHFIAALIKRIADAKANGAPQVEIWGDGTQVRECLYIDDQIDALLIAAEKLDSPLMNIGGGINCSVRQVAEAIKQSVGYKGKLFYNADRFTGVPFKVLDSTRFGKLASWAPKETLETGIEKTAQWYEASFCCI